MNNTVIDINSISAPFNIPLKQKDNTRTVNIASLLILLISLITCLYPAVLLNNIVVIIAASVLLLFSFYWLYRAFTNKPAFAYLNVVLLLVALYWFVQGGSLNIFIGLTLVFAALFEKRLKRPHLVTISNTGVAIQTSLNTTFEWPQLNNVIIKDGLLTIDTKSNKLYQKELATDITALYEAEINEFCAVKLNANS